MDSADHHQMKATVSEAHPETMDFLSRDWCNFAVQAFQPAAELQDHLGLDHNLIITKFENHDTKSPYPKIMDNSLKMDDADRSIPPWKSNDVKSWIWMQQAMHPELNYNSCFRKKWLPWKMVPFSDMIPIKKWLKEMKQKRKEDQRLQRAEVHAAISVAGVAAALAAIAAENSSKVVVVDDSTTTTTKESTVASAAALVAAQCAQVAEAMGAKKEQLSTVIGSAMSCTTPSDILTLTAAAATSLRGAATLKARSGYNNRLINGSVPVLPIQENDNFDFNFDKGRSILAKATELSIQTSDNGRCMLRSVSVILTSEAKVILKIRKLNNFLNAFSRNKESIVLDIHAELYRDSEGEESETCYLIVLTTNGGMTKLDMGNDYRRYKIWATTINQMLMLSTSFTSYQLQFYRSLNESA